MSSDSNDHLRRQRMLGAWALDACSAEERRQVDTHLAVCAECAAEAARLRSAVDLLHPHMDLDLAPTLRAEVLGACLGARAPEVSVPDYAQPYDAETARLDALLADLSEDEWSTAVQLEWLEEGDTATRSVSVAGVVGHLLAVDGMVGKSLGLPDPLTPSEDETGAPQDRTEALWRQLGFTAEDRRADSADGPGALRETWRDHAYELIRTCSFAGGGVADIAVPYGDGGVLPLRLALLDRAFETWIHAADIAAAVDYPYNPPVPEHLRILIAVAVQMLPSVLAARRQAGLASPPLPVVEPGASARSLRLQIEGESGGEWYVPLDGVEEAAGPDNCVSHVVLDEVEFCRLAAGHLTPRTVAAGQRGDPTATLEFLYAAASMSRL
ncbi:zf-HC2 domain-containing protein [Streptomyces sp. NPDC046985]|uniref:zf-HC2 domain-containing protein n=1 Tax=Streptomyces sp. NPDC046985 TaxID=3155377 RepID=UPI0033E60FAB